MVFLEIEHPTRERVVLPLRDGAFLFPPQGLAGTLPKASYRLVVRGSHVELQDRSGSSRNRGQRVINRIGLHPGESVELGPLRLTLREGSQAISHSKPPQARAEPGRTAGKAPQAAHPDPLSLRVRGEDRWVLLGLFASGRVGQRELDKIVTTYRNHRIAGANRSIAAILRKDKFLGARLDEALDEVQARYCLGCSRCQRVFEPTAAILKTFRCLECDWRLTVRRKSTSPVASPRSASALVASYDRLVPGVRLGDYKIEQLLGVGGYGAVYRAHDTRIQRTVALKVFPLNEDTADVVREARNVARFPPHPNLVLVYHAGQALGFDYISYEYVHGRSLAYHMSRKLKLTLKDKLRLMRDVLSGLAVAHGNGVIHRDMKPDNILLVRIEGQWRARVTDFGLGRHVRNPEGAYHTRTIRGAPEYLAPEQFRTQVSSVASDLYSVGATFFQLLAGRAPYRGGSDGEIAERHLEDPVPHLTEFMSGCPRSLERLFLKLLAKQPKNRPSSAHEVLQYLIEAEREIDRQQRSTLRQLAAAGWVLAGVALLFVALVFGTELKHKLMSSGPGQPRATAPVSLNPKERSRPTIGPAEEAARLEAPESTASLQGVAADTAATAEEAAAEEVAPPSAGASDQPPGQETSAETEVQLVPEPTRSEKASEVAASSDATRPATQDSGGGGTVASGQAGETGTSEQKAAETQASTAPDEAVAGAGSGAAAGGEHGDRPTEAEALEGTTPPDEAVKAPAFPSSEEPALLPLSLEALELWLKQHLPEQPSRAHLESARGLRLVVGLLGDCVLVPTLDSAREVRYLQRSARRSVPVRILGQADSSMPIYGASEVRGWVEGLRKELAEQRLEGLLSVRVPRSFELRSDWVPAVRSSEPADLLEWVEEQGVYVAFDHALAQLRQGSDAATFRRPSTARLHVAVLDFEGLKRWLEERVDAIR